MPVRLFLFFDEYAFNNEMYLEVLRVCSYTKISKQLRQASALFLNASQPKRLHLAISSIVRLDDVSQLKLISLCL